MDQRRRAFEYEQRLIEFKNMINKCYYVIYYCLTLVLKIIKYCIMTTIKLCYYLYQTNRSQIYIDICNTKYYNTKYYNDAYNYYKPMVISQRNTLIVKIINASLDIMYELFDLILFVLKILFMIFIILLMIGVVNIK